MSPTASPIENSLARQLLRKHALHLTAIREQVLCVFLERREAIAQSDLEAVLGPVNRITLYRTLRTFEEKGLIHRAIDGTEKLKFALCHSGCSPAIHLDRHAHLHCGGCGRTVCVDGIQAPDQLDVPGFVIKSAYLVLQGLCEGCR
ncbi:MAG: Fur family transcriptional regulator [Haliscomenobacter sp.]